MKYAVIYSTIGLLVIVGVVAGFTSQSASAQGGAAEYGYLIKDIGEAHVLRASADLDVKFMKAVSALRIRQSHEEAERQRQEAERRRQEEESKRRAAAAQSVVATAYCLSGTTATGTGVGRGIIAVDPGVIPLGSLVEVSGYGQAIAADTGGAIVGNRIDVWLPCGEATDWGVRTVSLTVLG